MIKLAWDVRDDAISGAPRWVTSERFDVTAKTAAGTPEHDIRLMMQKLLERDFKIQVHIEQRPMEVWVMTVAKDGVKMERSTTPGRPDCKRSLSSEGVAQIDCNNMTATGLAKALPDLTPGYIDRAVVDRTGLTGAWDVKLSGVPKQVADEDGGPTIFDSLDKQAGLKLSLRTAPMPVVVIDHIEKLAEN